MATWKDALAKTRGRLSSRLGTVFRRGNVPDEMSLEELEETLLQADVPVRLVGELIADVERGGKREPASLRERMKTRLVDSLGTSGPFDWALHPAPWSLLVVGVNGSGKTTTSAKLAYLARASGRDPLLGAADTFRAAGSDQLRIWAERVGCDVVAGETGADAAAVAFDALAAGRARGKDVVIIDTAGRMHTRGPLMQELAKVRRSMEKCDASAPQETWMVLDATLGQNALHQAREFHRAVPLTGVVVSKLDGSAKAGFLFGVSRELAVPIRFAGLGEEAADLVPFEPAAFVDALLGPDPTNPANENVEGMSASARDQDRMQEAIALARKGEGSTRPNPPVGAVLYRGGARVGAGYHRKAGGAHAEITALREAGTRARGATLYVTLEPCSTTGRTGPCIAAIEAAGIARVVAGATDPNPTHAGRGFRRLRRRGIEVVTGVESAACAELVAPFRVWVESGRPFVTVKIAASLDGRIADRSGASKWITGAASRKRVQELRRRCDAILVGATTIRADNPSLLPRPARGRSPFRIVAGGSVPCPPASKVFTDARAARTLVMVPASAEPAWRRTLRGSPSELVPLREAKGGRVRLRLLLAELGRRGLLHVLCEGGGELAAALVRADLVDELHWVAAPCLVGGRDAVPAIGGAGWRMGALPRLKILDVSRSGEDVWIRARPQREKK